MGEIINLFPRNGRGVGPGGRRRYRRKSWIRRATRGNKSARTKPNEMEHDVKKCLTEDTAILSNIMGDMVIKLNEFKKS